jgi:hypothetical protein
VINQKISKDKTNHKGREEEWRNGVKDQQNN